VIDEIGPLELSRGGGFRNVLPVVARAPYRAALIVVRPSLVAKLREVLGGLDVRVYRLRPENREEVYADLLAELLPRGDRAD